MLTERAPAKINLYLEVFDKMDDGYHEIETVFHSISLSDTVTLRRGNVVGWGIRVTCDDPRVAGDDRNTAFKAADLFFRTMTHQIALEDHGLSIHIEKSIPSEAGLGGGSADAAAVIRGLNRLYGLSLDDDEMRLLGEKIGFDVPFCIKGGAARGRSRGEELERLTPWTGIPLLLCKPPVSIRTAEAYDALDHFTRAVRPRSDSLFVVKALHDRDLESLSRGMYNAFEGWAFECYKGLSEYKNLLLDLGARGVVMSGSGPTLVAIFGTAEAARNAKDALVGRDLWVQLAFTTGEAG